MGQTNQTTWTCDLCGATEIAPFTVASSLPAQWSTVDLTTKLSAAPHSRELCPSCTLEAAAFLKISQSPRAPKNTA